MRARDLWTAIRVANCDPVVEIKEFMSPRGGIAILARQKGPPLRPDRSEHALLLIIIIFLSKISERFFKVCENFIRISFGEEKLEKECEGLIKSTASEMTDSFMSPYKFSITNERVGSSLISVTFDLLAEHRCTGSVNSQAGSVDVIIFQRTLAPSLSSLSLVPPREGQFALPERVQGGYHPSVRPPAILFAPVIGAKLYPFKRQGCPSAHPV